MSLTIQTIDNSQTPLGELLRDELRDSYEFMAASAFLNSGGLEMIAGEMRRILESEGQVSIVHGADFRIADPDAIQTLVDMKTRYPQMSYRVHCDWSLTRSQSFHPKLYLARKDCWSYCAAVGSSNLTRGGLRHNTEVNVVIRGESSDAPIQNCLRIYNEIHDSPSLIEPNAAFVNKYAELYGRAERLPLSADAPASSEIKNLLDDLMESAPVVRAANLRAPRTQLDFVAAALMRLGGDSAYIDLQDISSEAERIARSSGKSWDEFHDRVRSRLWEHRAGDRGRHLFEWRGQKTGQYRLSEEGRAYARRLVL